MSEEFATAFLLRTRSVSDFDDFSLIKRKFPK
jgi:hypothetical protein